MRALIFDLDGTLVDTVYAHVFAWQRALAEAGMPIDGWRIHRRIGMSGGLMANAVLRETGHEVTPQESARLLPYVLPSTRSSAEHPRTCGPGHLLCSRLTATSGKLLRPRNGP